MKKEAIAALGAILAVSCATAPAEVATKDPAIEKTMAVTKVEALPAILVRTQSEAEGVLSLFRPDDWCSNRISSKACVLLSEYYAPFKHAPAECWQTDESEEVLRCCVWEVSEEDATDDRPDTVGPVDGVVTPTSTWCTLPEDPCRKWESGDPEGC